MHKFTRNHDFGRVEYVIDHLDTSKSSMHMDIDYEYTRMLIEEEKNHRCTQIWSVIFLIISVALSILNGVCLSAESYTTLLANVIAAIIETILVLLSFVLIVYAGCNLDEDSDIRKLEDLYTMTDAGLAQFLKAKEEYELKEKAKNDLKADKLITVYDTLDSELSRQRKLKIISSIIKEMENE